MCLECPHGYIQSWSGSASCDACPKGQYNPVSGDKTNYCVACDAGKYQPETSSTTCFECAAGDTSEGGTAVCAPVLTVEASEPSAPESPTVPHEDDKIECPPDSRIFQDFHGFKYCISNVQSCPAGMHSYEENHAVEAVLARYHCAPCPAGKFSKPNSACTGCPSGKYVDHDKAVVCKFCAPGKITGTAGQLACTTCSTGKFQGHSGKSICEDCFLGRTGVEDGTECKACSPGPCTFHSFCIRFVFSVSSYCFACCVS